MPEFLERRFSADGALGALDHLARRLRAHQDRGRHLRGRRRVRHAVARVQLSLGGVELDSFWIGSLAVVVLTGLYTVLGGMRAVAYTEAVQTIILVLGSAAAHLLRPSRRSAAGANSAPRSPSDMFNLWKPLVPAGMEGTWAPVKEAGRIAWYFNGNYPWLGMLFCAPIIGLWYWCTDQYIVQRTLGAPSEREARRGTIFASFLKLLPVFIFIIPGCWRVALAKTGQGPGAAAGAARRERPGRERPGAGRLPADGAACPAGRHPRAGGGGSAGGADELARRRLQRLLDALHHGPLQQAPAGGDAAPARLDRPRRDDRDGADRARLDPRDPRRARPLRLPAGRAGLPGPADLHRLLPRASSSSG